MGTSSHYNILHWLGHNSATGPGHRGAQISALHKQSGPELFPGGLDADSDVVPAVRCQQERGGSGSQHGCGMVCVLACPFCALQGLSHTRLMAAVEVLKWILQLVQTEAIHHV